MKKTTSKQSKPSKTKGKGVKKSSAAVAYGESRAAGRASEQHFISGTGGSIRIQREEFVGTVTNGATTGYMLIPESCEIPGLDFNPACAILFPWGSAIASSYERYHFNNLSFRLIASNPTTTAGRVYMAIDYDYDDVLPENKVALMSNRSVAEGPVWDTLRLSADSRRLHEDSQWKYCSINHRTNFVEPRTAYAGFLLIAVDSPTANLSFDLVVSYDVSLSLPVLESQVSINTLNLAAAPIAYTPFGAVGGGFGRGVHIDQAAVADPTLPQVKPSTLGTPGMALPAPYNVDYSGYTYDLQRLKEKDSTGTFTEVWDSVVTGSTPATILSTFEPYATGFLYDAKGNFLGAPGIGATPALDDQVVVSGPAIPGQNSVVSSIVRTIMKYSLSELFRKFPSVRYIAPFITSIAASGVGTSRTGVQVEL